jgi:lipopolysaccharide transport system permease protein
MSKYIINIDPDTEAADYWKDVWKFRGLFFFLAWRDTLVRYKQTVIGILWSVIKPLLTIATMGFLGWLMGSKVPDGSPRILLVCAATLPWQFFASSFSDAANSLIANANLLTKVYFPRLIIPASTVIVCLIDFLISFLILLVLMFYFHFFSEYHYSPSWRILLLPLFLLLALIASMGAGLYIAALNVKYRDFRYVIPFIVQFGLYISPVAFSSSSVLNNVRIPLAIKYVYSLNRWFPLVYHQRSRASGHQSGYAFCGHQYRTIVFWSLVFPEDRKIFCRYYLIRA